MSLAIISKAPIDVLDYDFDFSHWLPADDFIISATAAVSASSTAVVDHTDVGSTEVRVWLAGGIDGESATLTLTIITTRGRTKEVLAALRIRECN